MVETVQLTELNGSVASGATKDRSAGASSLVADWPVVNRVHQDVRYVTVSSAWSSQQIITEQQSKRRRGTAGQPAR